jgi:hypothetical protein
VQAALDALATNTDESRKQMLLLTMREARDQLNLRISEVEFSVEFGDLEYCEDIEPALDDSLMLLEAIDDHFQYE